MTCHFEFNMRLRNGTAHVECNATLESDNGVPFYSPEIKSVTWTFGKNFWDISLTKDEEQKVMNQAIKAAKKEFVG